MKQSEKLDLMAEMGKDLLEMRFPEINEKIELEVRYFGHGNRFTAKRNGANGIKCVVYFHATNSVGEFKDSILVLLHCVYLH